MTEVPPSEGPEMDLTEEAKLLTDTSETNGESDYDDPPQDPAYEGEE